MLQLTDQWMWDFWAAHDGRTHHLFYLAAPHDLGSEERRHRHATIRHSTSGDLRTWVHHGTVLRPRGHGFDATATWTGNIVQAPDGSWRMFYTGARYLLDEPHLRNIEAIGVALSNDLDTWQAASRPVVVADPRWYEVLDTSTWPEEAWRDPWVYPDPDGDGWHMLVTARARRSAAAPDDDAGVIGSAWSADLETWEVRPPRSRPGSGFGHLEVPQVAVVDGRWFLLFSCPTALLSVERRAAGERGGVWSLPIDGPDADFDVARSTLLLDERFYSGRIVADPELGPQLLAVVNRDALGEFVGVLSDPMSLTIGDDGHLVVATHHRSPARDLPSSR